jgi:hypothetical protein
VTTAAADKNALSIEVRGANGGTGRTVELPEDVFGVQVNIPLRLPVERPERFAIKQQCTNAKDTAINHRFWQIP